MKKNKILYIGNKLSNTGNTKTSIETLGQFLEDEDFILTYASSKKNKILRLFDMIFTTIKQAKKNDFVLIDVYSTTNFWYAIIISQLCRVLKVEYIAKLHGGNLPNRLKNNPKLCDLIFKKAYKNIAPSSYLYDFFNAKYPKNTEYIPNTIQINEYPLIEKIYDYPRLLWVRSFAQIYNPKMAVLVLYEVQKKYPLATLCMVGPIKDNSFAETQNLAKELNLKVEFTGLLSKNDWIEVSKNYSIFINTTHFDNTPVSVIEAMALGLPIISTNVGGIPNLIKNNEDGLLVNDNDVAAMKNAVLNCFENPNLRNKVIANSHRKATTFDWETVKYLWFKLLQ